MAYYAPDTSKASKKKEEEEKKERKSFAPVTLGSVQTESENKKTFAPITVGNAQILTEYYKQVDSKNAASARNATWIPNTNTAALNQNLEDQGLVPIFSPNTAYKLVTNDDIYERIVKNYNKKKTEVENEGRPFSSTQYNTYKNTVLSYQSMIDNGAKLTESQLNAYRDAQSAVTEYETWEKRKQAQVDQINLDIQKAKERIKIVGGMTDEEADLFAIMAESDDAENVATTTEAANAFASAFSGNSNSAGLQPTTVSRAVSKSAETKKDEARQKLLSMGFTDEQIDEYLLAYKNVRNDMIAAQRQLQTDREARQHPILSSLGSIPVGLVGGVTGVLGSILEPGVRNDPTFTAFNNYSSTVQASVRDEIESAVRKTGVSEFWVKAAGYGYSGAMSAVQSAAAMGIGSAIGAPFLGEMLLGAGAASQAYNDALINGHSYGDALLTGTIAGLIETLTEHVSLENLRMLKNTAGLKNLPLNLVKSFITEGSEEIASDVLNEAWDYFAHGGLSEYEKFVSEYLDTHRGATEAEAKKAYASQFGMQILESGIVGGISGLLGTGWTTAANGPRNYIANTRTGADYQAAYQQLLKQKNEGADVNPNSLYGNLLNLTADLSTDSRAVQNAANAKDLFTQENVTRREMRRQGAIINDVVNEVAESEKKGTVRKIIDTVRGIEEEPSKAQQYRIGLNKQANNARVDLFKSALNKAVEEKAQTDDAIKKSWGLDDAVLKKSVDADTGITPTAIASIEDGKVRLSTQDGKIVDLADAKFKTEAEAAVYNAVAKLGYDVATANKLVSAIDYQGDASALQQLRAMDEVLTYAKATGVVRNGALTDVLNDTQKNVAYQIGNSLMQAEDLNRKAKVEKARASMIRSEDVRIGGKKTTMNFVGFKYTDKTVSDSQRAQMRYITQFARYVGRNRVVFFASKLAEDGKTRVFETDTWNYKADTEAPHAFYEHATGDVYVDINAGNGGQGYMLFHAAHEYGHHIVDNAPARFQEMLSYLVSEVYGEKTTEGMIRYQREKGGKDEEGNYKLSRRDAAIELFCDSLQEMFTRGNIEERLAKLKGENPGLWQQFKDFVSKLLADIKAIYKKVQPESWEARELKKNEEAFQKIADMFAEASVEAGQNFEAMSAQQKEMAIQTGEVNLEGEKSSHSNSLRSYAVCCGYDIAEVDGIYQVVDTKTGKPVKTVSGDVIKDSPLGNIIDVAVRQGNLTQDDADKQYEMLANLLDMCVKYKDFSIPWEIAGSVMFSAIKANSDAQYGRTIDFSTICKKTQSIINVMSRVMLDTGRGLTAKEVREVVYKAVGEAGEPTPCPVCYVFSRWMGIGGILQNIYDFQLKYNDASKNDVMNLIEGTERKIRAFADKKGKPAYFDENGGYKYGKIIADMKNSPDGKIKRAQKAIDAHYDALETIAYVQTRLAESDLTEAKKKEYSDILKAAKKKVLSDKTFAAKEAAIEAGRRELKPLEEYQFIKNTRFNSDGTYNDDYVPVKGENGKTAEQVLASVLFDLNNAEGLATKFPALWRYRSTRGCNAGKAILPYSDMWTGEVIQGIVGDISDIQRGENNAFMNGDTAAQQKLIDSAIRKTAAQNLIGGMRFQSTSDFRYEYGSDYLMAFLELQAIGSNVQLYTKVIEAVDFFASMGADINLSLMPENDGFRIDENGNRVLAFSSVTGIHPDGAFKLISTYDNVQAILVGISDEHIAAAMADSRIGFIIPFHGSGNTVKVIADLMNLLHQTLDVTKAHDYSLVQNDKERAKASYHGDTELYEKHKRLRDLRMMILTGNDGQKKATFKDADLALIRENAYLSDLYDRMWVNEDSAEYGVRLSKSQAEKIFPFEYWDKSLTLAAADQNGARFIEYCESLGLYPRFSGEWNNKGEQTSKEGDFRDKTGYWKLLIDRPMYALDGTYREQQKINATSMQTEYLLPSWGTGNYAEYKQSDSTKDMNKVDEIAKKVEAKLAPAANMYANGVGNISPTEFESDSAMQEYVGGVSNSLRVTEQKEIDRLEAEPKLKLYRSLIEINGKFYSPMSTFDANGKLRNPYEFGVWYRSVEDPDHAYPVTLKNGKVKYKFDLFKGGQDEKFKKNNALPAVDYNPYEHQTDSMFNDQFTGAYQRPNLVLVEFEVPASEDSVKYRAPKAALTTGWNSWHAGPVAAKIKKAGGPERKLFLSRWVKLSRIVPVEEVAQNYKENLSIAGISMPDNLVPPNLLKALIEIGVPIEKSGKVVYNDNGMPIGWHEGKKIVSNGIDYSGTKRSAANMASDKTNAPSRTADLGKSGEAVETTKSAKGAAGKVSWSGRDQAPTFYSTMERAVENMKMNKIGADSVLNFLKGRGVKDEEIKWSGIRTFLEGKKSVTKEELQQFIRENKIQIETVVRDINYDSNNYVYYKEAEEEAREKAIEKLEKEGVSIDPDQLDVDFNSEGAFDVTDSETGELYYTYEPEKRSKKWEGYKLEGGENYREYNYKLPGSEYTNRAMETHWRDKGIIAHARVQDFETEDGDRVLFIEEIQSDWHNAGAKGGKNASGFGRKAKDYSVKRETNRYGNQIWRLYDGVYQTNHWTYVSDDQIKIEELASKGIFSGPEYEDLYPQTEEEVLKDLTSGMDDFSVPDAPYAGEADSYIPFVLKNMIREAAEGGYDYIGWTTAAQQEDRWQGDYNGVYKIEYDQEIPKFLKKYGKQWDAQVEDIKIGAWSNTFPEDDMTRIEGALDAAVKSYRALFDYNHKEDDAFEWASDLLVEKSEQDLNDDARRAAWDFAEAINTAVGYYNYLPGDEVRGRFNSFLEQSISGWQLREKMREFADEVIDEAASQQYRTGGTRVHGMNITESMKESVLYEGQASFSARDNDGTDARTLLSNALAETAQTDAERDFLQRYQTKIADRNKDDVRLGELRTQIREMMFAKGPRDAAYKEKMAKLQQQAKILSDRISRADKKLLELESTKPLKRVLLNETKRAAAKARDEANQTMQQKVDRLKEDVQYQKDARLKTEMELIKAAGKEYNALQAKADRLARKAEQLEADIQHRKDMRQRGIDQRKSTDLRERIKSIRSDFIHRLKKDNTIPPALVSSVIDVCDLIDPTGADQTSKAAEKYRNVRAALLEMKQAYEALKNNKKISYDFSSEFSQELADRIGVLADAIGNKPLREMSRDQLEDVYDALTEIRHTLLNAKKILGEKSAITNYEASMGMVQDLETVKEKGLNRGMTGNKISTGLREWMTNPLRAVREMTGYNANSWMWKLFNGIDQGLRKGQFWEMKAKKVLEPFQTGENRKLFEDASTKAYDFGLKDLNGKKLKISKMQAMQILLTYERETQNENRAHLANTIIIPDVDYIAKGKYSQALDHAQKMAALDDETIAKLRKGLNTEFDLAFMDAARKVFQMSADAVNETSLILKGRAIATEKAYIPYEVFGDVLNNDFENVAYDISIANMGMTKSVLPNSKANLVMRGLDTVMNKHMGDTAKYYGLAIPVRNFTKAYNTKLTAADAAEHKVISVKNAIRDAWGYGAMKLIEQAVADVQGSRPGERGGLIEKLRSNLVQATLAANFSVWIKQAASYPTAGNLLSTAALFKGLSYLGTDMKKSRREALWAEIDEHTASHYIRRQGLSIQELAEFSQSKGIGKKLSKVGGHVNPMNWIQSMDVRTTAALWVACKAEVKAQGLKVGSEEYWNAVTELYDKVIEDTQPMYDPLHRAEITKDRRYRFIMFQTQPIQNSGILREATMQLVDARKQYGRGSEQAKAAGKGFAKAVVSQLVSHTIFALMSLLGSGIALHKMGPYRDDDDKEVTWEAVMMTVLKNIGKAYFGAILPVVGSYIAEAFDKFLTGNDYSVVSDMTLDAINNVFTVIQRIQQKTEKGTLTVDDCAKAITEVAKYFGIPAPNGMNIAKSVIAYAKDIKAGKIFESDANRNATQKKYHLYEAIVAGDYKVIDEYRNEKGDEWSSYIQTVLKEYDERIVMAAVALNDNDTEAYEQYMTDIYRDVSMSLNPAYTSDDVTEAVRSMVNTLRNGIKDLAQAKADGNTEGYEKKLESLIEDGFDAEYIENLVEAYELDEDETEEEAPSLYKAVDINNAFAKGDFDKVRSMAPGFKTKDAYDGAVKAALRKYDPRIKQAAQARYDGDTSEYKRLVDDIVGDGYFSQEIVVEAIKAETTALGKEPKETDPLWYLDDENFTGGEGDYDIQSADAKRVLATGNAQDIKLVYDSFVQDAINKGNVREDAIKSAQSSFKTAIKNMFIDGDINMAQVTNYLKQYGGQTDENDIYWLEREWQYNKDNKNNPDAPSYKKYTTFYEAVQSGKNLKDVISEYTTHGVTAETMAKQITTYFKPIYKSMNNTERASLKGYLLNAYVVLGYNRYSKSKDIDKWLTQ